MSIAGLSTHQTMMSDRLRRLRARASDIAGACHVRVSITSGVQSGMTRRLRASELSIGAGAGNDIILLDKQVSQVHAHVRLERSAFGTVADVTALDQPVSVNGDLVPPGERREAVQLPVSLQIGGTQITLDGTADGTLDGTGDGAMAQTRSSRSSLRLDPVLGFTVVVFGGLLLWTLMTSQVEVNGRQHSVMVNDPVAATVLRPVAERDWTREIEDQVAATKLEKELVVAADSSQLIRISGLVPATKLPGLRDLQTWYDGQKGAPTVIWDIRRKSALSQMPPVTMVRLSQPQHVLLSDGAIVRPGETILDDWVLAEIDETGIVLARGTERTTVQYRELIP